MKWAAFLHVDTDLRKLNVKLLGGYSKKWVGPIRSYGTLKSSVSWSDESSRFMECFLQAESDSIFVIQ